MPLTIEITGFYTGLLALLYIVLSINIIRLRWKHKVGIGDGDISELAKAVRVHGNFSEFIPIALILLAAYELSGGASLWLHICGGLLFVGRVFHALGLTKTKGVSRPRQIGVLSTYGVIIGLSIANILAII